MYLFFYYYSELRPPPKSQWLSWRYIRNSSIYLLYGFLAFCKVHRINHNVRYSVYSTWPRRGKNSSGQCGILKIFAKNCIFHLYFSLGPISKLQFPGWCRISEIKPINIDFDWFTQVLEKLFHYLDLKYFFSV